VRVGEADPSLTGVSGLAAVTEFTDRLGVVGCLDRGVGPGFKQRDRGLSAGQTLLGVACAHLLGEDALVGLDRLREDTAGMALAPVPLPPSRRVGDLARRFDPERLAGIEAGLGELTARWLMVVPGQRRVVLLIRRPTVDLDSTDVEVYGSKKEGVAYNYLGQRAGRPHVASWAEAHLPLAADLLAGDEDVRPRAAGLFRRALAGLPTAVTGPPRVRADAGYFSAELAQAVYEKGGDFAIAAKRNRAAWRAYAGIEPARWRPARDMPGAEVAVCDYAPAGWPPDTYTIVRRVRVNIEDVSADPRSRRRRTIPADQLTLALDGNLDHVYAVSFLVTNLPIHGDADIVGVESWFRARTDIEERFREAKLGHGLNHLPSGDKTVNTVWMWAALLAGAISVMLQSVAGIDTEPYRARPARLRHELLRVPARLIRHARGITLRLPPGPQLLPTVLSRLRTLPMLT